MKCRQKDQQAKFYARHKERRLAANKARYDANPEKYREYSRKNYRENREHYLQLRREYHEANRDRDNETVRKWRAENPEKAREGQRASYRKHREARLKQSSQKWYADRLKRPWLSLLESRRWHARQKNIPFGLTESWAAARWTGRCELTDLPFDLSRSQKGGPKMFSPSLDKIAPELGYIPSNCRFILLAINVMKQKGTDAEVLFIAEAIVKNSHKIKDLAQ